MQKNEGSATYMLGGSNLEVNDALNIYNLIKSSSLFPSTVNLRDLPRDSLFFNTLKRSCHE